MNKKSKEKYNYEQVCIYFNLDNPYQKECYELLNKIQKKKSLFLGMLAHNFLSQFKEGQTLTADDLKNYIQYYEIMEKKREQPAIVLNNEESITSVNNERPANTEPAPVTKIIDHKPHEQVAEAALYDEQVDNAALQAIKAFKF